MTKKKTRQKWEPVPDKESDAQFEREVAFMEAVAPFLARFEEQRDRARERSSIEEDEFRYMSSGSIARDVLGGEIFYVYLLPPENKIRLGTGFAKRDIARMGDLLPSIRSEYLNRMPSIIKDALSRALHESLGSSLSERSQKSPFGFAHGQFKRISWFHDEAVNIEYKTREGVVEISRFPRKRRPRRSKLTTAEQAELLNRFQELHTLCSEIKTSHDAQHREYQASPKVQSLGYYHDKWVSEWIRRSQQLYDQQDAFLRQFAEPSNRGRRLKTASEISYEVLSRESGHAVSYLEKLLTKQRKENGHTETDI